MPLTNFPNGITSFGVPVLPGMSTPFTGNFYFVDPVEGSDGNRGTDTERPFQTLYRAHSACKDGNNDVVFLISNGLATGTARLSLASAQINDPTATVGTLVWSKSATHLVGIAAPGISSRARISNPTGTYTAATFGANTLMSVTGSGCLFSNISVVASFSTGNAAEIPVTVSGSYNVFNNCALGFPLSAAAIGGTAARALTVTTGGENSFNGCVIGSDTVIRSVLNSTIELAGGTARNQFNGCTFNIKTSSATSLHILGTGNNCISAYVMFKNCVFMNLMDEGSTNMTTVGSFTTASPNGSAIFPGSACIGATKWGDANFLANSYVDNVGGAATAGLMLNPT